MEQGLDEKKRRLLALLMKEKGIDPAKAPIVPRPRRPDASFPLSFAQERLWVIDQLEPGSAAYNLPMALRLEGKLDPALLSRVFTEIVRRHETLRTTFGVGSGGRPVQVIAPPAPVPVPEVDLSGLSPELRQDELQRLAHEEARLPFDLARGPVLRLCLIRLGEGDHGLLLTLHHIASDGWSNGILVSEVGALYAAFSRGLPSPLPELPVQYADYAVWQRQVFAGEYLEKAVAWWRERLAGAPVLELPTDRPRPAVQGLSGATVSADLPLALVLDLKALARAEGATLFMVVTAAFLALLSRLSGQTDLTVGTPVANRHKTEVEGLIGFFVNTLVLRTDLSGEPSFRELLGRVREVAVGVFQHGEVPFSQVVEEVRPERSLSHTPLFQAMCTVGNAPTSSLELPGLRFTPVAASADSVLFDLSLTVGETGEGGRTVLQFRTEIFDRPTILRLLESWAALLAAVAADPDLRLPDLPLLPESERHQVLFEWGPAREEAPARLLHQAFADRAALAPDAPAVEAGGVTLSYGELRERALAIAHRLRALGVAPEDRVAVCIERSAGLVAAILGILEAGAAYVPFDPVHPRERLAYMAEDAGVRVIVASDRTADKVAGLGEVVVPRGDVPVLEGDRAAVNPDHLAYVIYTSGSTGRPKGVMVPHRAASAFVRQAVRRFEWGPGDRVLQAGSPGFDVSVAEIFGALSSGACLCPAEVEIPSGPDLAAELRERAITVALLTPTVLASLGSGADFPALRLLPIGGERTPAELARRWVAPGRRFFNCYGPTETTVFMILHEGATEAPSLPIGRAFPEARVHGFDRHGRPVPVGVPGELLIGGSSLARGYLGQPDRTAAAFVPDPWGGPGERLYRTGDLVRWLPNGELDILGRIDRQVKVRGVRIELGEIESVLASHPGIDGCGVVPRDGAGGLRLVAFFAARDGESPAPEELRAFLRERLPEAMVPSLFVPLPALPMNASGKLDRRALAKIEPEPAATAPSEEPRTEAERRLAGIWAEVLGIERVGLQDNFFELGGQSLLATQLVSRVREAFEVEIPQRALFEAPTVGELARVIEEASAGPGSALLPALAAQEDDGPFPLSFAQERLWLIDQIEPGNAAYNMGTTLRFEGSLEPERLASVLSGIVRRHATLRTTYGTAEGTPVQIVHEAAPFPLPVADFTALPGDLREDEARRVAGEEGLRPFDLARGPIVRAALLRLSGTDHVLAFNLHHIASDGWSMGVLVQEVMALYSGAELPPLPVRYVDYAAWQRRTFTAEALEGSLAYWREKLSGIPVLELPTDRPRPPVPTPEGAAEPVTVPAAVSEALKLLGRSRGATPFMTLAAAFAALLSRYTGQADFGLGTPVAGRNRVELEGLIGFFVNTLVLRTDLFGDPPFSALLARVREAALGAFAHEQMPFERLVEELNPERSLSHPPLFQVMFALQNVPSTALDVPGLKAAPFDTEGGAAKFDLSLAVADSEAGLGGALEYRTGLFDAETVRRTLVHWNTLLAGIAADPDRRLSELPLLPEAERHQVLFAWNPAGEPEPEGLLHQAFAEWAQRAPDAPAVEARGVTLSYGELRERALGVAHLLRARGVAPDDRVAVCVERPALAEAILGVLEAGAAYLPFDPAHPRERLAYMAEDAGVRVIVASGKTAEKVEGLGEILIPGAWAGTSPAPTVHPGHLAYVIYTSGSTGRPKGVMVPHGAAAHLLRQTVRIFGLGPGDRVLQAGSPGFDISVSEIFGALSSGACLCPAEVEIPSGPDLAAEMLTRGITASLTTPAVLASLGGESFPALRVLMVGGDKCPADLARRWAPGRRFFNAYGPTEATVLVTLHEGAAGAGPPPIGRAIPGTRVYVLDRHGHPAPVGVPGELAIGGAQLARGYQGQPDRTAAAFVPDPLGPAGGRLYKTGDLVRWLASGELDILGRIDRQVKVRGVRVELGEIEAVLGTHPDVRELGVVVREGRLAAFVVPRDADAFSPDALRAYLRERLPEAMIPSFFVPLPALPLTASGKLDRRALAKIAPVTSEASEAPRTEAEARLAAIWESVLGVPRVGISDSFFDLGGHSLLATQLVARVREAFGVEIPLRALFEAPTVAGLAARIAAGGEGRVLPPVVPVPRKGLPPLSFAQERLWVLDQLEPETIAYNLPTGLRLVGHLRPDVLARAFSAISRRHEALRTTFAVPEAGGAAVQVIAPPAPVPLPLADLSELPDGARDGEIRRLAQEEGTRPFDLVRGPVWRNLLARLGEDDHALLATMHHIASDGWSMGVLVREIVALYGAFSQGLADPLPELPVQYADYALWQRRVFGGGALDASLDFWRRELASAPVLDLPTDRPRTGLPGAAAGHEFLELSRGETDALEALGRRHGATLFMVTLAAFQALLGRYSGQSDLTVGTPIAGRLRTELEPLIGFFVNTLVLRGDLGGDPRFGDLLERTRARALAAFAHQQVPFEQLVVELNPERSLAHTPLFQVMFALQNAPAGELKAPGLSFRPLDTGSPGAKFDLTLTLGEGAPGLAGSLEYRTALFDAATIRRMLGHLATLLAGAAAKPDVRLSELPLLPEAERRQVTALWSGPWAAFPETACLPELFDRQASGAVAVTFERESLTYGELRARANGVAHRLRRLGVGPESRVGLAAERSFDLIVGLLGILKAGGAYVPIDPSYPEERLAFLLEDSGVPVLLAQAAVVEKLPPYSGHVLLLEEDETVEESPAITLHPDNAAYVIYTSGSTGKPKGTVVTHRNVARLLASTEGGFGFGPGDVWTLFHSCAFDFSVWEIWGALAYGGRLVIVPYWVSRSPEAFLALLEKERVTVLNQTPSAFRQLGEGEADLALRLVIFGGEALEVAALAPWFDRHGDEAPRLVNMYGITETTVHVTWRPVMRADLAEPHRSPIGPAIPDLSLHLLDAWGNPAPIGVPGELCVGGPGLARGYLGRPDLTAERYVPHPFAPGERLYRSGDLARFRPGGEIDYLGRIDHQVKIRGFRIELGEIEAALARHPRVDEAVVLVREESGDRRLVAYLGADEALSTDELRALLAETLPDFMIPSAFVVLPALPLTANGKVERRALLEIRPEAGGGRGYVPPRTPTEEVLAGLWASVLSVERVGIRDNFFDLGGHSLVATRLVARVRQVFGVEVPLRALFEGPTVEELARRVETGEKESAPPIVPLPRDGAPLPLSFAQERLWFLDQFEPGTPTLNIPLATRLPASVEPGLLARALAEAVRRHEALRTTFGSEEGRPFQQIGEPFAPPLPVTDLTGLDADAREREAARLEAEEGLFSFDLARGPLLRARLLLLGEESALLLTVHHIVSDGWSMGLLTRELGTAYRGLALPELPVQYADYAVWQRRWLSGAVLDAQIAYWREKLADPPVLDLPTDRPRPAVQTWRGAGLPYTLAPELTGRLAALARQEGATLFMVLLAGFSALLARLSGQDDVIVGAPVAGRVREETEPLVGCFLNNVALRTDLSGRPSFRELLARARATALEAYAHQDVPFEKLLEELAPKRDLSRTPIFQVFLNMLNFPAEEGGEGFGDAFTPEVPSKFDLTIYAAEGGGALHLDLVYNADLFDRERVEEMARQLERLLARAVEEPEAPVSRISLVTEAALLPDPAKPLDASFRGGIHEALSRQDPERVAVVEDGRIFTYGELQAAASGLAGLLASQGLGRGEIVAVWAHRSAVLPGAVLGVLRAGAVFMVLDPAYPASRLVDYLRIGRPAAFVAIAGAAPPPPEVDEELAGVVRVELPAELPSGGPPVEVGPEDLAVLTFTSGSTGRPKGVAGRHGPLTHFYPWMAERFGLSSEDRFGMLSALSHDPLQRDLFTPVWLGAALCVPDPERIGSPGYLADWVRRERVTVLHLTPAMLELLVQAAEETGVDMPSLRRAFVVGDLLKRTDVERLYTVAPGITCINLYGSTETQRSVSCFAVPREARPGREVLPLGRGMEDAQLLVLNPEGALAGVGELGEIHMRSAHLALGYLGDPGLTAERFLPDQGEIRRYRTGDLGRYRPDGDVEFAGRADAQVKIRGFRIEPGEIEAALARFPGVRESVVIVRDGRLVAYAVPRPGAEIPPAGVRAFLAERLPGYMVPADVVVLPALPLTRTGKIDRRALPAPERTAGEGAVAPRTATEETLAGLWRELLGVEDVGVEDDFFDRGGHSLLATQLLSRLRTSFGVELPLRALFERPTIAGMAALLAESGAAASSVPPLARYPGRDEAPLSFAQQRLWFLDQLDPGSSAYNIFQALRLEGDLDEAAFEAALRELVRRQESLRTRFVSRGGQAVQEIDPPPAFVAPVADLSALPAGLREREGERIVREEALRPFDLQRGPVLRARLLRLGAAERWLVVSMHHTVSDGVSLGIFIQDASALYNGSPLPELAVQYTDFARWQRSWLTGEVLEQEVAWWRERLAGAPPVLGLPFDRPRPALPTARGGQRSRPLPDAASAGLLRLARSREATPFMAGLALVDLLLARHTGEDDLVVGTPIANRGRRELEGLIGFFANTLALRLKVRRDLGFADLLDRVREAALGAYSHQDVPFEKLVEDLSPERSLRHTPLFQVMFVMAAAPFEEPAEGPIRMSSLPVAADTVQFDLTLSLVESPRGLALSAHYDADLFFATTIGRMLDHAALLLTGLVADPHQPVGDLPLLSAAERSQLVTEWNDNAVPIPPFLFHELFERQLGQRPDAVAAVDERETVSFRELDARAGRLARYLRVRGAGPEVRVGLSVQRSVGFAVSLLGILRSGAAWVPLDPAWPRERLDWLLEDAGVSLLLTEEILAEALATEADGPLPPLAADPDRLAYVLYTSGSTGRPKGVAISHRGVANLAASQARVFGIGPEDRLLQLSAPSFDASVAEIATAWWTGAELHFASREALLPGEPLARLLAERRITVFTVTPSALLALPPVELPDLAVVIAGGEACPQDLADRWAPGRRFFNDYGPTEVTVSASFRRHRAGDPITLGRPIANGRTYLLDDRLGLVPLGVPGELAVASVGVARGYFGRPDLTADRFRPDPWGRPGDRLYLTGDLGRRLPDGEIEFLGRADQQVKVRGVRIEPGEVEAALLRHPAVREAVAGVRGGELVAWMAASPRPTVAELRRFLDELLPQGLIPTAFVFLDELPKTPAGKTDRRSLPDPGRERGGRAEEHVPPETPEERLLAEIWTEVLHVEGPGATDNFFDLGGHSLLATQLLSRIRDAFSVEVPLRALFERPTIRGIAGLLAAGEASSAPPLVARPHADDPPLSFAQQRLWFIHQLDPGSAAYNMHQVLRLRGELGEAALEAALRELVRRQAALRTRFVTRGHQAVQVVGPVPGVLMPVIDLSALPDRQAEAERIAREESLRPFHLETGPVLRVRLLRLGPFERLLAVALHHIVSDGWSLDVFVHEVTHLYAGLPLPPLPVQYADYARWQREWLTGETLEREIDWWRRHLAGAPPVLDLPLDRPRPALQSYQGDRRSRRLPEAASASLLALAHAREATPFMAGFAFLAALLARHTGADDLVIGTPIANRNRREIEGLIGFFANTLALRARVRPGQGFSTLLDAVRETALGAYTHQDVPFERIVEELAPERNLSTTPLFQVVFVMNPAPPPAAEAGPLSISAVPVESEEVKFDLVVSIEEGPRGWDLTVRYNSDLFLGATIERLLTHAAILLAGIAADPERPLSELPILTEAERLQVTRGPEAAFPVSGSLTGRFEEQARRNPSAVAAVFEGTALTYGELDLRSNRLARHLRRKGVGPEVRVGLAAERSLDLVVGLLAILKAGGAYVPIDPSYPEERLSFLLEDAFAGIGTPVLLAGSPMPFHGTVVPLDGGAWEEESGEPLPSLAGPGNAAYVIYTSGSTGKPKGTIVTHANVLRLFAATESGFGFGPGDVWTLFHSYAFDFSVWEIWGALLYGGRLVVVPFWVSRSPGEFLDLLARERVTVLNQTPSAFRQLVAAEERRGGEDLALRFVVFGGEALDLQSLALWLDRHGDLRPRLVNMYGITETAVHVTWRTITRADLAEAFRSPVGAPIPDLSIHLLDAAGQPVPVGVAGEIHVGGAGLARGYLGRPDLTAERYVPNPFAAGERLYRSGDLARWRPEGGLDFLGRIDHQVKVRGFRIELGEIEAALGQHPAVKESVVLLRRDELVAWLGIGDAEPPSDLRAFLAGKLPEHMIPAAFVVLPALPLTAHGKVDRRALPDPGAPKPSREAVPPTNAVERFLADLWESVLGITGVGIHDDFFELGGSSIKAAILTNALEERLGEYVFVVALFDAPTIARLAVYLETHYPTAVARITGAAAAAGPAATARVDEATLARFRSFIHPLPPPGPERAGRPKNPPAVFLLSPPRSGSTLLRVMLGGHPDLFAPPELELLSFETLRERKAAFSGRYSFWTEGTLRALMEIEGSSPDEARGIMESCEERDWTVRDFYRELQKRLGHRLLVDKTPSYALDPNVLARAEADFDEPVYIHLVRHPYGMIRSFEEARLDQIFFRTEHPFARRELAELIWTESEKNVLEFLAGIPAHRQVLVRFEDLVRDPRREMEKICAVLGIDLHPAMLDPYEDTGRRMTDGLHAVSRMLGDVKFHEHQGVDADAADRWKQEYTEDFLGDVTWDLAGLLGYEVPRRRKRALVPLAVAGPGTPFFCVHPAGGNVLCYADLARAIGPDRPFYGLQSLGLSGREPQETVEEMAASYLTEIRGVQPHGPYFLGGWSLGGVVAYEMARRLREEGEEVALLVLLDAVVPGRLPEEERLPREEDADVVLQRIVAELEPAAGEAFSAEAAKLADLPPDERLRGVLDVAKRAGYLPPDLGAEQVSRLIRVYNTNAAAWRRYRPAPYPGRALLLRAKEGPLVENPSLNWHGLLTGEWETVDVPGTHQALMAEPAVHDVAGLLKDRLRRSDE
ncbi:MAG TPA: non-ribosomal peptide synthase/polyketide synthase [Thermoanaerobaculia bacterium]|nr:non-ribosomal peptide synthase/polyketide synthase [Thermoanaerobaculia bacterium]